MIPADSDNTIILITSALYADAVGRRQDHPVAFRLERIVQSLKEMDSYGFKRFVLVDNTLPPGFPSKDLFGDYPLQVVDSWQPTDKLEGFQPIKDEFQQFGPSRLEAALLFQALPRLQELLRESQYILKISAGYRIANFAQVFEQAQNGGAVFRMGNPLRRSIPFCLTSFYLLPTPHFLELVTYFYSHIRDMRSWRPLEYYLYRFITGMPYQRIRIPYPRLRARFLAAGKTADDPIYRIKEKIFDGLSRLGLYAYRPL